MTLRDVLIGSGICEPLRRFLSDSDGGGGGEGVCALKPANPTVLNLCLPAPPLSAPLPPSCVGSYSNTQPGGGRERFSSFRTCWEAKDGRWVWEDVAGFIFLRFREELHSRKIWKVRDERSGELWHGLQQAGVCDPGEEHLHLPSLWKWTTSQQDVKAAAFFC